jgi:hypothetical protein
VVSWKIGKVLTQIQNIPSQVREKKLVGGGRRMCRKEKRKRKSMRGY